MMAWYPQTRDAANRIPLLFFIRLQKYSAQTLLLFFLPSVSYGWSWESPSGHLKYQYTANWYPENSVFRDAFDSPSGQHFLDNRWKFSAKHNAWDINVDYQLQGLEAERAQLTSLVGFRDTTIVDDDRRAFDLTHILSSDDDTIIQHRLDRANIGYTSANTVIRLGRQVLSWGNGLMFNPMDFFNPFDPAALDKEYKTGDDMVYGQHLFNSGADLQLVGVARREFESGDIQSSVSSFAAKYHTWLEPDNKLRKVLANTELDLLAAQHYDDEIVGLGLIKSLGGAIVRGDLTLTHTDDDNYLSLVTNLSYSWVWRDTNFSGALEYFYNGFGLDGDYSLTDIQTKPDLYSRLLRGELYTTGKHYFAASATIELTPLLLATPSLFVNLGDQSALLQISGQYDIAQDWQLIAAATIPIGPSNTEYGGLKINGGTLTSATDGGLFVQIAWYF